VIGRREFLRCGACTAAAFAALGCGLSVPTAPDAVSGSIKVSDYAGLTAVGGFALVTVGGSPLAVVRTGAAAFTALSRICPHQGATISPSGNGFTCPRHGAEFSLDGAWVGGQRTSSLHSYATRYDPATDTLTIS